jgi:hypothetical protein
LTKIEIKTEKHIIIKDSFGEFKRKAEVKKSPEKEEEVDELLEGM